MDEPVYEVELEPIPGTDIHRRYELRGKKRIPATPIYQGEGRLHDKKVDKALEEADRLSIHWLWVDDVLYLNWHGWCKWTEIPGGM